MPRTTRKALIQELATLLDTSLDEMECGGMIADIEAHKAKVRAALLKAKEIN